MIHFSHTHHELKKPNKQQLIIHVHQLYMNSRYILVGSFKTVSSTSEPANKKY